MRVVYREACEEEGSYTGAPSKKDPECAETFRVGPMGLRPRPLASVTQRGDCRGHCPHLSSGPTVDRSSDKARRQPPEPHQDLSLAVQRMRHGLGTGTRVECVVLLTLELPCPMHKLVGEFASNLEVLIDYSVHARPAIPRK